MFAYLAAFGSRIAAASPATPPPHAEGAGGEALSGGVEWVTPILGHDGKTGLLWILVNFAVLMWVLERLLFSKLRARQAHQHDLVKTELSRATAARGEAEALISEYRGRLDRLDDEIVELTAEAERRAEADRASIIAAAKAEAERIQASAKQTAEREAEIRRRRIENEIVDRAVERAETLLRQKFTPADQDRMVGDYIQDISALQVGGKQPGTPAGR
jgi:F-type H+-transporting ATPase subunit b